MKKITGIIIGLLLYLHSDCQIQYNNIDSSYTFTYNQLIAVRNSINTTTSEIKKLQSTINLLEEIDKEKTVVVDKLRLRDSLYNKELDLYKNMDILLRDKLSKSNEVILNYKTLLLLNGDELKLEISQRKKEAMWKNIYKIGYPILIVAAGILVFK